MRFGVGLCESCRSWGCPCVGNVVALNLGFVSFGFLGLYIALLHSELNCSGICACWSQSLMFSGCCLGCRLETAMSMCCAIVVKRVWTIQAPLDFAPLSHQDSIHIEVESRTGNANNVPSPFKAMSLECGWCGSQKLQLFRPMTPRYVLHTWTFTFLQTDGFDCDEIMHGRSMWWSLFDFASKRGTQSDRTRAGERLEVSRWDGGSG